MHVYHHKKNQGNLKEIIKFRLEKIEYLIKKSINPYPYNYLVKHSLLHIISDSKSFINKDVSVAGRIISLRKMGKTTFINIQDMYASIQVYIKDTNLNENLYNDIVRKLDLGDIVGVNGIIFYTKTKELSIKVSIIELLSKNIRPLPNMKEKNGKIFFSFNDKEQRYRKRYLDFIINSNYKNIFIKRFNIINALRSYLNTNNYIEVETPILQPLYGGANARPFTTYHNTLDEKLYLRIADELYLKRLIVGGFDKVYEMSKNFRNEGMDRKHNPEFTMLEFYCAFADIYDMMKFTESMLKHISKTINYKDKNINFNKDFSVFTFFDAIDKFSENKISRMNSKELEVLLKKKDVNFEKNSELGELLDKAFSFFVESNLIEPTFIIDYPKELSPLAKQKRNLKNSNLVERFELFIDGMEIANAFTELNDPLEQRKRFIEQSKLRDLDDHDAQIVDEDFLEALETGMPPTGGVGIGIDRLVMILTNQKSIKDVILFPAMKNEINQNK